MVRHQETKLTNAQEFSVEVQFAEINRLLRQLEDLSAKLNKAAHDATVNFKSRSGECDGHPAK